VERGCGWTGRSSTHVISLLLLGTCNGSRRERHADIDEVESATKADKEESVMGEDD